MRIKINVYTILFDVTLFCIFILPVHEFELKGFILDKYIFLGLVIFVYGYFLIKTHVASLIEMAILIFAIFFCFIRKDVSFLHVISIALIYKLIINEDNLNHIKECIVTSVMPYISLLFVGVYSFYYFGAEGRFLHTAVYDPNMSGLSLFCLFTIIREKNRTFGNLLLLLGVVTFSKSYMLALLLFYLFELLNSKNKAFSINYGILSLLSIALMVILSSIFIIKENAGQLHTYAEGFNRFFVLFDYSNYFRFTLNTNVIYIYKKFPSKLLTGIPNEEFFHLNYLASSANDIIYRRIRPHNYFFAYFQIYGIWCIPIFVYTYKTFKQVTNKSNNSIAFPIFLYLVFLGIGATNYWLYLSIFTLIISTDFAYLKRDNCYNGS